MNRSPILKVQIENLFESLSMQTDLYADEIKKTDKEQVEKKLYKIDIAKIIDDEAERIAMRYIKDAMKQSIEEAAMLKIIEYKLALKINDDEQAN